MDRVFLFWSGEAMSWLRAATLCSLCKLNPERKIELFIPNKTRPSSKWHSGQRQDFSTYTGEDFLPMVKHANLVVRHVDVDIGNGMHQSDWLKWDELAGNGGWFSDMDIVYTKPIPDIEADAAITSGRHWDMGLMYWSMGLMYSSGDNEFFRKIAKASRDLYDERAYESTNQNAVNAVARDMPEAQEKMPGMRFFNIPKGWVYPWPYPMAERYFKPGPMPECIGLHWYAGTSVGNSWNVALGPESTEAGRVQEAARAAWA